MMLVIALILTSAAGCGGKVTEKDAQKPASETGTQEAKPEDSGKPPVYDTKEKVDFTVYWNYNWWPLEKNFEDTEVGKELGRIMNCRLTYLKPDGDPKEKLNIMLASDDLPDVIVMDRDANYQKLISAGKLVALDDYIAKYPGYRTRVDASTINFAKVEGKAYSLLNWPTTSKHPTGNGGWMVNEKIYKEMGAPEIKNLEDVYNYLVKVKEKNIKINGKDVVPLQMEVDQFLGLWFIYFSCGGVGTISNEDLVYVNRDKNQLKFVFTDPRLEQALLFANKLWNADLINKDYFVETSQQKDDKRNSGRLAVYTGSNVVNEARDGKQAWQATDKDASYVVVEPPAGPGMEQKDVRNNIFSRLGWNSICITRKAKNPERIFQVFDYIASDEGQLLTFHGPKGVLWVELDEKGYPIIKKNRSDLSDEERKVLAAERYSLPGMSEWVDLSKVAADNRRPLEQRDPVIQAQAKITWNHSVDITEFQGIFTDPTTDEGIIHQKCKDLVKKMLPKIIMAKDEAEARKLIKETADQAYKIGFEKVENYKTKIWLENKKVLGQ